MKDSSMINQHDNIVGGFYMMLGIVKGDCKVKGIKLNNELFSSIPLKIWSGHNLIMISWYRWHPGDLSCLATRQTQFYSAVYTSAANRDMILFPWWSGEADKGVPGEAWGIYTCFPDSTFFRAGKKKKTRVFTHTDTSIVVEFRKIQERVGQG